MATGILNMATECNLRKLLLKIDSQLADADLQALKFLASSFVKRKQLSEVKRGLHLFQHLERLGLITTSDISFLYKRLQKIGRQDLCTMIDEEEEVQVDSQPEHLNQNEYKFYEILFELSEDMGPDDIHDLTYLCVDLPKSKKIVSGMDLFSALQQRGSLDPFNVEMLIDHLKEIGRVDLSNRLYDFQVDFIANSKQCVKTSEEAESGNVVQERIQSMESEEASCSGTVPKDVTSNSDLLTSEIQCGPGKLRIKVKGPDVEALPRYKMDSVPRGFCLVVNNQEFTHDPHDPEAKQLNNRRGSDNDVENISNCFTELCFRVRVETNLSDVEMLETFKKYAMDGENKRHDCFVTFLLSHGGMSKGKPYIYGSNGRKVQLDDITNLFRADSCPDLVKKPKMFFLASCLGSSYSKAVPVKRCETETDSPSYDSGDSKEEETTDVGSYVCNDQDFLIGLSTVEGNVSFRDTIDGTWYITALTQILLKYHKKESLHHMLIEVNDKVAKHKHKCANEKNVVSFYSQVPGPRHTLTKQLWF